MGSFILSSRLGGKKEEKLFMSNSGMLSVLYETSMDACSPLHLNLIFYSVAALSYSRSCGSCKHIFKTRLVKITWPDFIEEHCNAEQIKMKRKKRKKWRGKINNLMPH